MRFKCPCATAAVFGGREALIDSQLRVNATVRAPPSVLGGWVLVCRVSVVLCSGECVGVEKVRSGGQTRRGRVLKMRMSIGRRSSTNLINRSALPHSSSGVDLLFNGSSVILKLPHYLLGPFPQQPLDHGVQSVQILVRVATPLQQEMINTYMYIHHSLFNLTHSGAELLPA